MTIRINQLPPGTLSLTDNFPRENTSDIDAKVSLQQTSDLLVPLTTKGDLLVHNGTSKVRIPVGVNGTVLTANSAVTEGVEWATNSGGDVTGPGSATDNALTRFDGTTGKIIQNSVVTLSDTGAMTGIDTLAANNVDAAIGQFTPGPGTFTQLLATVGIDNTPIGQTTRADGAFAILEANQITATPIEDSPIGQSIPADGKFATLEATALTQTPIDNATMTSSTINTTPIGNAFPDTGVFTTLEATTSFTLTNKDIYPFPPLTTVSGTAHTLTATDTGVLLDCTNAATVTITIETNAVEPFDLADEVYVRWSGTGEVQFAAAGGVTIQSEVGATPKIAIQYGAAVLKKTATNTWWISGRIAAI